MNTSLLVKLNFLVLGLFLVTYFIFSLNRRGLPGGIAELFGATPQAQVERAERTVRWCETRVRSLVRPEGFRIEQRGMKWFGELRSERELNFIAVEKWFGRYCAIRGEKMEVSPAQLTDFRPILFVKFIDESVQTLGQNSDGVYIWRNETFRSSQLDQALNELKDLVEVKTQD